MIFPSLFSNKFSLSMSIGNFLALIYDFIDTNILRYRNKLPRNWPILGMLPAILFHLHRLHDLFAEVLESWGEMTGATTFPVKLPWFLNMDIIGTAHPEDVHHIMSKNFENYPKGPEFKKIFEVLGDSVFTSDSESWKQQRKLAQLFFNNQGFQNFIAQISWDKVEKGLIPFLEHAAENGLVVDIQDVFQRLSFDTACKFTTGYDPGCLTVDLLDVEFARALDEVEDSIVLRYLIPHTVLNLVRFLRNGKDSKAYATFDNVIYQFISMKKEEIKRGPKFDEERLDLLASYLLGNPTMDMDCDDKFLRDAMLGFLIAGRDTTSSSLTWFLWLVSTHPRVERKIRVALEAAIPAGEAGKFHLFKADDLRNQIYLHAALCETLRLYPPAPFQHKSPLKPDILPSGHFVDPKMKIVISIYSMGRMKSIWGEDYKEFKPERWISESGKLKREPSYRWMAFNAGPRTCIGKEVAFIQMKAVAAALIHNYSFEVVEGHSVVPNVSVFLYMKQGLKVKITKRWK